MRRVAKRLSLGVLCCSVLLAYVMAGVAYFWVTRYLVHYHLVVAGLWALPGFIVSMGAGEVFAFPFQYLSVVLVLRQATESP